MTVISSENVLLQDIYVNNLSNHTVSNVLQFVINGKAWCAVVEVLVRQPPDLAYQFCFCEEI